MSSYWINTDEGPVEIWDEDLKYAVQINEMCEQIHNLNEKWWTDPKTGKPISRNVGEMIALSHSELSEALEGHRKMLNDDHLPHRSSFEVELADLIIRVFDMAHGLGYDLGTAFVEKTAYNKVRKDHTAEHRLTEHGKKY